MTEVLKQDFIRLLDFLKDSGNCVFISMFFYIISENLTSFESWSYCTLQNSSFNLNHLQTSQDEQCFYLRISFFTHIICPNTTRCLLCDFNVHFCCLSQIFTTDFMDSLDSFNLAQAMQVPTHSKLWAWFYTMVSAHTTLKQRISTTNYLL